MIDSTAPAPGQVCIWQAQTADAWPDDSRLQRAMNWLSRAERARYDRYRRAIDREMFLLGRVMARVLVGRAMGVAPGSWEWREGPYGRPEVSSPPGGPSFNLAHSAGLVVCALAREGPVGADVEYRQRPAISPQLVARTCSPREVADITGRGPAGWSDRFLTYWTLKEAYLKARGLGIAVHLRDISFAIDDSSVRVEFLGSLAGSPTDWAFTLAEAGDSHFVAAAAPAPTGLRPDFVVRPFPPDLLP